MLVFNMCSSWENKNYVLTLFQESKLDFSEVVNFQSYSMNAMSTKEVGNEVERPHQGLDTSGQDSILGQNNPVDFSQAGHPKSVAG